MLNLIFLPAFKTLQPVTSCRQLKLELLSYKIVSEGIWFAIFITLTELLRGPRNYY